jgi:hypothetical protein
MGNFSSLVQKTETRGPSQQYLYIEHKFYGGCMTTRAGLRATIRAELNDGGVPQLWGDLQLNEWIVHAIRDYGRHVPRESSATIVGVAGQADYNLPADCLRVARVEHPSGFSRIPDPLGAGDVLAQELGTGGWGLGAVATQLAYEVWGPFGSVVLTLRPAPTDGTSILVRYLATWAEPSSDSSGLATPSQDDHLLVWYVAEAALQWLSTDESKRQRFERQRGVSTAAAASQYQRGLRREYQRREERAVPRRLVVRE